MRRRNVNRHGLNRRSSEAEAGDSQCQECHCKPHSVRVSPEHGEYRRRKQTGNPPAKHGYQDPDQKWQHTHDTAIQH